MVVAGFVPREIIGKPSTARVQQRYKELLDSDIMISAERCALYTDYMREHWLEPICMRQGGALKHVFSNLKPSIRTGELIVGSMTRFVRGANLYPEYEQWIRESFQGVKREEERYIQGALAHEGADRVGIFRILPEDRAQIEKTLEFWNQDWRTMTESYLKQRDDFDLVEKWQLQLVFFRFGWSAPEGRMLADYGKVIDQGLEPIMEICRRRLAELNSRPMNQDDFEKYDFYQGTLWTLEGAVVFAENHALEAERQAETADAKRRAELLEIARTCRRVPRFPATTFREAMQCFWFLHVLLQIEMNARGVSPGRFDQYMYPTFKADIESGRITREEALELLELMRIKCSEIQRAHSKAREAQLGGSNFQNLTLGGTDANGNPLDNELSQIVLQAGINVKTSQPTISIRWSDNLSHEFKLKAMDCIKAGSGYPALFNDWIGIRRFIQTGIAREDAWNWAPCGCVDMQISNSRAPQWIQPTFNALKLLELVLHDGVNPLTGDKLLDTGIKIDNASYDEIKAAWRRALSTILEKQAIYWNMGMLVKNKIGLVMPLCSALLDDCIERGMHCQAGGCRYNESEYFISCGMINVANSLAAIKKCVFDDKAFTMKQLREALDHNYAGYEAMQKKLLDAPKFGNGDEDVDGIAVELYDAYSAEADKYLNHLGEPYRPSALSVTNQVIAGNACSATPDGRRSGEQICDGSVSAYPGTDLNGPTSIMVSAAGIHAENMEGNLLNIKFHPDAIKGAAGSDKFIALNDAYFDMGGYHVQYNIVDAKMLRDAQLHPENYPDLMIRVAGFTARWVELGKTIQDEIIGRTEHTGM